MLRDDDCYLALKARDARFDGQFFTCVKSTGIYCRPICPARTPKRINCTFVPSAAAAEDAGYRPCLRCRPEAAPGTPEWTGSTSIVHRALRIMNESSGDELSLEDVSDELEISSRQLRRLFTESLGTNPKSVIQTNRIALARQLLIDTDIPIAEVAMSSGFGSIRRFNGAIRQTFGMTPSELRKQHGTAARAKSGGICVNLGYRPPYAWERMIEYLGSRGIPRLELGNGQYVRCVRVGDAKGRVTVTNDPQRDRIRVRFNLDKATDLTAAVRQARDLFDLDASPSAITEHLAADKRLRRVVKSNPGLRCPGAWSVFEMLVRAIVGQQVSVQAARTVLGRIVAEFGEPVSADSTDDALPDRLFPEPEVLADELLQPYGLNTGRAETINRIAEQFASNPKFVHTGLSVEIAKKRLLEIKGVGPWTANYALLRALRYPDAFPESDLGAMKAAGVKKPRELATIAESWRPWRGYALHYLWSML